MEIIQENIALQALLAFMPILVSGILLIGLRWSAKKTMPIGYLLAAVIAFFAWEMSFIRIIASTIEGLVYTASNLWTVFGSIF